MSVRKEQEKISAILMWLQENQLKYSIEFYHLFKRKKVHIQIGDPMNVRTSIIQAFFSHSQISEYSFKCASVVSVAFAFQLHTPFRKILRECIIMSADHFVLALSLSICLLFKMISFAWSCANTKKKAYFYLVIGRNLIELIRRHTKRDT